MPFQIGYTDSSGHPWIRIRVSGTNNSIDIDALIDTGFTGFLMLPQETAVPLGLTVIGSSDYILADGSKVTKALARGRVIMGPAIWAQSHGASAELCNLLENSTTHNESVEGAIVLGGDDPLLGMELVRALNKSIAIGPETVALVDQPPFVGLAEVRSFIESLEKINSQGASSGS